MRWLNEQPHRAQSPVKTLFERLMSKVDMKSPEECWIWQGAIKENGYGAIRVCVFGVWRMRGAHRVAYELANGSVDPSMDVCHACDNRRCVNPTHLWLGTRKQNQRDMAAKGRVFSYAKNNPDVVRDDLGRFARG